LSTAIFANLVFNKVGIGPLTTCISCRRLMTLITDNLTKGNRKNIESALIGGQLNAMVRH